MAIIKDYIGSNYKHLKQLEKSSFKGAAAHKTLDLMSLELEWDDFKTKLTDGHSNIREHVRKDSQT